MLKTEKTALHDFTFSNSGSICTITSITQQAKDWVKENVPLESWQCSGQSFYVEPRYVERIFQGITEEGLTIQIQ